MESSDFFVTDRTPDEELMQLNIRRELVPGSDFFIDGEHADILARVPGSDILLPGTAYNLGLATFLLDQGANTVTAIDPTLGIKREQLFNEEWLVATNSNMRDAAHALYIKNDGGVSLAEIFETYSHLNQQHILSPKAAIRLHSARLKHARDLDKKYKNRLNIIGIELPNSTFNQRNNSKFDLILDPMGYGSSYLNDVVLGQEGNFQYIAEVHHWLKPGGTSITYSYYPLRLIVGPNEPTIENATMALVVGLRFNLINLADRILRGTDMRIFKHDSQPGEDPKYAQMGIRIDKH